MGTLVHAFITSRIDYCIRDFKMWYGEAVVRRQIVKMTSGDVMKRVPDCGFRAVALLSTTGKCLFSRTLHYVSISLLFTSHFNDFFTV